MFLLAVLVLLTPTSRAFLEEKASWHYLTFAPPPDFPGANPNGDPVVDEAAVIMGLEVSEDRFFLSIPRLFPGRSVLSLGWLPIPPPGARLNVDSPIVAYPDWASHRAAAAGVPESECSGLTSVTKTGIDACNRLWVLDSGVVDVDQRQRPCPPKLLAFDLETNTLVTTRAIPPEVVQENSFFFTFTLDPRGGPELCDDLYIYLSDNEGIWIVVYDVSNDAAWRVTSSTLNTDPENGDPMVDGERFTLVDGAIGLAAGQTDQCASNFNCPNDVLYFQTLSSDSIYSMNITDLISPPPPGNDVPVSLVVRKPSVAAPIAVDRRDFSILYSPLTERAVYNFHPPTGFVRIRAYDAEKLQTVFDLVSRGNDLWIVSNKFQRYRRNTVSGEEINQRIVVDTDEESMSFVEQAAFYPPPPLWI